MNELGTLRFLEDATNVLLIGPPGVGKTMLAVGSRPGVDRRRLSDLLHDRRRSRGPVSPRCARRPVGDHHALLRRAAALGHRRGGLPAARRAEAAAALFQVITQRYLKSSIVMTTNLGVSSWGKIFDDPMVAAAMLDRLLAPQRRVQHRRRELPHALTPGPHREHPEGGVQGQGVASDQTTHRVNQLGNFVDRPWGVSEIGGMYGGTLTGCKRYAAAISSVVGADQRESKRGVL